MKNILWDLIKLLHLGPLMLLIHPKSTLRKSGWFKSFHKKQVIDKEGNPIPWWTYSFIDFLSDRLTKNMRVLEFGCGASTIYFSQRVNEIVSFENYKDWAIKIRKKIHPGTSQIIDVKDITDFNSYQDKIIDKFDLLIIDNLGNRMQCAEHNIKHLKNDGVVIWDNTDGPDWGFIKAYMIKQGFKEISFTGMIPQELSSSKTTLFYKEFNCLNI